MPSGIDWPLPLVLLAGAGVLAGAFVAVRAAVKVLVGDMKSASLWVREQVEEVIRTVTPEIIRAHTLSRDDVERIVDERTAELRVNGGDSIKDRVQRLSSDMQEVRDHLGLPQRPKKEP